LIAQNASHLGWIFFLALWPVLLRRFLFAVVCTEENDIQFYRYFTYLEVAYFFFGIEIGLELLAARLIVLVVIMSLNWVWHQKRNLL
jgi:hypothetical protein